MLWLNAPNSLFSLSKTSSYIRFGDRNPAFSRRHRRLLTQKRIFSPAYHYTVETSGNRSVKCYITRISAGLWLDYLHISMFIPVYHTAVGIKSTVEIAKESSNFQYKLWENHDLTVQPVIAYFYSCGRSVFFQSVVL